jgi:hypothetical protein
MYKRRLETHKRKNKPLKDEVEEFIRDGSI